MFENFAETISLKNVEIMEVGIHNGKTFNREDLKNIVEAFQVTKFELKPMAKLGHSNILPLASGMPAVGWIEAIRLNSDGNKILADFEDIPSKVGDMLENKMFRRISSEFIRFYVDEQGNRHDRVLKGVAFLGADIPAIKTLQDVSELLSDKNINMEDMEVFTMDITQDEEFVDDTSPDLKGGNDLDIDKLKEVLQGMDEEERSKLLSEYFEADEPTEPESDEPADELEEEVEEDESLEDSDADQDPTYSEEYVGKLESRVEALEAELRNREIEQFLDKKIQDGQILAKTRDNVKDLILSLDQEQYSDVSEAIQKVEALINAQPKVVDTEEYTQDIPSPSDAEEVDKEVEAILKA